MDYCMQTASKGTTARVLQQMNWEKTSWPVETQTVEDPAPQSARKMRALKVQMCGGRGSNFFCEQLELSFGAFSYIQQHKRVPALQNLYRMHNYLVGRRISSLFGWNEIHLFHNMADIDGTELV